MIDNLLRNFNLNEIDILGILIRVFVIVISLSIHEASHAFRAYKLGDDTAYRAGRMTLNPLVHLDPVGTLMMFIARVGWAKPVPINPVLFTRAKTMKRGILEVSLAGPLSNLVLAFISYFLHTTVVLAEFAITGDMATGAFLEVILRILDTMFWLNVFLAAFNLLPVPPLDGYKIFGSFLPDRLYYKIMEYERYIGIAFILLIVFGGGIFSRILTTISTPFYFLITWPVNLLANFILKLF